MKIFRIDNGITRLMADSAIVRNDRPVFRPDFASDDWVVEVRPAVTIGRLGKFIAERFAWRYVESLSLCAILRPAVTGVPDALIDSFDGAIVTGLPFAFDAERTEPLRLSATCRLLDADAEPQTNVVEITQADLAVARTIAAISERSTLKSGDIILPSAPSILFPARLNTEVAGFADSELRLLMRVK